MIKPILLVALAIPLAGISSFRMTPLHVSPTHDPRPSTRAVRFTDDVEPLLNDEWWATLATKCGDRSAAWLASVNRTIKAEARHDARSIWFNEKRHVPYAVGAFATNLKGYQSRAQEAPRSVCTTRRTDVGDEMPPLDQMAKAGRQ